MIITDDSNTPVTGKLINFKIVLLQIPQSYIIEAYDSDFNYDDSTLISNAIVLTASATTDGTGKVTPIIKFARNYPG